MNAKLVAAIVLIVMVLIFVLQNVNVVELRFLFWTLTMSRALLFILLLVVGMVLGWLIHGHSFRTKHPDN